MSCVADFLLEPLDIVNGLWLDNDMTKTEQIQATARQMVASQTTNHLIGTLRHSLTDTSPGCRLVQVWVIEELERRQPTVTDTLNALMLDDDTELTQAEAVLAVVG